MLHGARRHGVLQQRPVRVDDAVADLEPQRRRRAEEAAVVVGAEDPAQRLPDRRARREARVGRVVVQLPVLVVDPEVEAVVPRRRHPAGFDVRPAARRRRNDGRRRRQGLVELVEKPGVLRVPPRAGVGVVVVVADVELQVRERVAVVGDRLHQVGGAIADVSVLAVVRRVGLHRAEPVNELVGRNPGAEAVARGLVARVDVDDAVRPRRVGGAALSTDAEAVLVGDRALVVDEVRLVGAGEPGRDEIVLDLLRPTPPRWRAAGGRSRCRRARSRCCSRPPGEGRTAACGSSPGRPTSRSSRRRRLRCAGPVPEAV